MAKNIQMTENTGSGYENIYPKTLRSLVERSVSNSTSLGGEKASNYLKKTEGCSLENLSVYINSLTTANITASHAQYGSFNGTRLPSLEFSLTSPYLYQVNFSSVFPKTGANVGNQDIIITINCLKKMSLENEVTVKFTPRSSFGPYFFVANSSFLEIGMQKDLTFSSEQVISGIYLGYSQEYSGYWSNYNRNFLVNSGNNSYVQTITYTKKISSSQKTVSMVKPQLSQWINQTQYYNDSQFLLDKF